MKKKVFLGMLMLVLCVSLFGCGQSTLKLVQKNMSELTKVYYFGENDTLSCSLTAGEREKEYSMDGKSGEVVDFCLLSLRLKEKSPAQLVKATVCINDEKIEGEFFVHPKTGDYMLDLERKMTGEENVKVEFAGQEVSLQNLSKDFGVDYIKALEIACDELEEKILVAKSFANLNAECYLRILDKKANDIDGTYWCFTVFNSEGKNYSVIISADDGTILTKSE